VVADLPVVFTCFYHHAAFRAAGTLTLPGIAGIVLTVGMAVDATS
jgi:preprotein translocase subunit SecD